jgi:hypothetical protein
MRKFEVSSYRFLRWLRKCKPTGSRSFQLLLAVAERSMTSGDVCVRESLRCCRLCTLHQAAQPELYPG